MHREADTKYPIHALLRSRWSPVAFSSRPVEPEKLCSLLEAARWSPSSFNEQPWSYIVAPREDADAFRRLSECLVEANRAWATRAAVLLLAAAKRHFDKTGKPNRHAWYDTGQSVAHLSIQATALGLHVHQMAGFDPDAARRRCGIPRTHDPAVMIAVGYHGEGDRLPEDVRKRDEAPRVRCALRDFVHVGRWDEPPTFL